MELLTIYVYNPKLFLTSPDIYFKTQDGYHLKKEIMHCINFLREDKFTVICFQFVIMTTTENPYRVTAINVNTFNNLRFRELFASFIRRSERRSERRSDFKDFFKNVLLFYILTAFSTVNFGLDNLRSYKKSL